MPRLHRREKLKQTSVLDILLDRVRIDPETAS
jgi:hypothetical protein